MEEKKQSSYIKLLDPPADFKRNYTAQQMLDKLYDKIMGNEFLKDFLESNAKRDGKWPLSEKQEAILRKIAFTFDKDLGSERKPMSNKPFDDGLAPMADDIPF